MYLLFASSWWQMGLVLCLRIHQRLSMILKTSKKVYEVMFFNIWNYFYSESIFSTLYIEIKHKCWKKYVTQNKWYKSALFFLSWAPAHYDFIFYWQFLYELKHKVRPPKTVCEIFHFQFHSVFIKVSIFVQQNAWTVWL